MDFRFLATQQFLGKSKKKNVIVNHETSSVGTDTGKSTT